MENHPDKSFVDCNPKGFSFQEKTTEPDTCETPSADHLNFLEDSFKNEKINLGKSNIGDPIQKGKILNDGTNYNTIYRYSKALRGTDEAVMDLFRDIVVIDEEGKAHRVPIIWGSQEKAVAAIVQDNVRKDNSLVVDRIRLPILAIHSQDYQFNQGRYVYHQAMNYFRNTDGKPRFTSKEKYKRDTIFGLTNGIPIDITYSLYAWTMYIEDMNQILEQIILKFSPVAYIKVRGVVWEIQVKLDSIANNLEIEPGDQAVRVVKFQFSLTAESYIPQPITRKKAVLSTKIELTDGLKEEDIKQIVSKIEETVKETKC